MALSPLSSFVSGGIRLPLQPGTPEYTAQQRQNTISGFNAQGSGYAYDPKQNAYISPNQGGVGGGYFRTTVNGQGVPSQVWVPGADSSATTAAQGDPVDRALSALQKIQGAGASGTSYGNIGGGSVPRVEMRRIMAGPDAFGAQNAAFGAVKARAGSLARSGLESLRANLAERGLLGGGTEARGLVSKLAEAINPESDYNVAALGENVKIAQQNQALDAAAAGQEFAGNVSQRNADLAAQQQAKMAEIQQGNVIAQRNQNALMGLINAYSKMSY